jgi:trans-aconitate 2-methyltransferase
VLGVTGTRDVYTFGDDATAAGRLDLLAHVYEQPTRSLLARWAPARVGLAVDLGCGPGHTTRLLHTVLEPTRLVGVERSPAYAALAREHLAGLPEVEIVEDDVTQPLPVEGADLVFARFLLTHLAAPAAALRGWARALAPDGRLIVQETARLVSRDPALGRYYELVAELQQRHGQALDVGSRLAELAGESGLVVERASIRPLAQKPSEMAALHVLNLRSWRHDPEAGDFDDDELDALDEALVAIARGGPAEPVEQDLGELVVAVAR